MQYAKPSAKERSMTVPGSSSFEGHLLGMAGQERDEVAFGIGAGDDGHPRLRISYGYGVGVSTISEPAVVPAPAARCVEPDRTDRSAVRRAGSRGPVA